MKPTARQKEICELIIRQAKAWRDTNCILGLSRYFKKSDKKFEK